MPLRSPVVSILGHVDHGKTTLLDFIRKSRITAKEHGGITQRIGAYEIDTKLKDYKNSHITFIDTPGHEAFSQLRARGANVADIALLIVDAKDSIMPQTIESISHIKAAKIPFIVVVNKVDLPDANVDKVLNDLLKYEVLTEKKGGQVPVAEVSAKTGQGVEELLETILLIATDLNLQYETDNCLEAYVIETSKNKGGINVSVVIKNGKITVGDTIFAIDKKIKVRSLINDLGVHVETAIPSTPLEVLGFEQAPELGSLITSDEKCGPEKKHENTVEKKINLDMLIQPKIEEKKLAIIIKTDSQGSLDAICASLCKKDNIDIILKSVGEINKSDIFLAKATKSIIIGFSISYSKEIEDLSKQEKVIIKTYNIIYELLEELDEVAGLIKEKQEKERNLKGEAKIMANFIIEREKIYGVKVIKGKINLGDEVEIHRQNKPIGKTKLVSLKTRAKVVNEVKKEQEAGMIFSPPLDIVIGDVVKSIL